MTSTAAFLAGYAKQYHAGAFATPTAAELASPAVEVRRYPGTVVVSRRLTRPSRRHHFTGDTYTLPAGATVATHVAREPGAPIPRFGRFDYVYAYREDAELSRGLARQGLAVAAVHVTAASEIVACWSAQTGSATYSKADRATLVDLPVHVAPPVRNAALRELAGVDGWHDDYPFYSDGTWSALSLRGFKADDPAWGVKPAEMSRAWRAEHPGAGDLRCEWTVLADRCPTLTGIARNLPFGADLERVRLLRMAGVPGGTGRLARHTDITDRSAGTRDGAIARFHLPLVTAPDVEMMAWDLRGKRHAHHLQPWHLYYLDQRKPHAVANPSGADRVHLVIDVVADAAVRRAIAG